jgi:ABC-type tungstate transport system permease subunit
MIVSNVKKQAKINKVVVVSPQASDAKTATLSKVSAAQERIKERAFAIFEKRGSKHGHDLQDWFHAESQILAR